MATANAPTARSAVGQETLDQVLDRQHELVLMREYRQLGQIDFIFVVRGNKTVKMDYRKKGPRLAWNPDTGDFLLLNNWDGGLPALDVPNATKPCTACLAKCGDCNGEGKKRCTLACGGTGVVMSRYVPCPKCLGGPEKETKLDCKECRGRGEVPQPEKCKGCDKDGKQKCYRCAGTGKVPTGREGAKNDALDPASGTWKLAPRCKACDGRGQIVATEPQDWTQFVHGRMGTRVVIGPIKSLVWHTLDESGRFQGAEIEPDAGGNLMVLLLDSPNAGAKQYLVGGNPQFK